MYLNRLNKLQDTLDENYGSLRRKCIGVDRAKRGDVREKIVECEELLCELKIIANHAGADAGAMAPPLLAPGAKVTKISPLKLPTFAGNYAKYKSFKESFNLLITAAGVEPDMIGHCLHDCLEGEA